MHLFSRNELLIGREGVEKLAQSKVVVFGVGGVGSFTVEALARAGVGHLDLVDGDTYAISNINRQLGALHSTLGQAKVEVLKERLLDINPQLAVTSYQAYVTPQDVERFIPAGCSYLVDAIDQVSGKLAIIETAFKRGLPIISSMGAGNKLNPTKLQVADISQTHVCPLARVMRRELKQRGIIRGLKVVYSTEAALKTQQRVGECSDDTGCSADAEQGARQRETPGSISFVASVAGLYLAAEVVRDLLGIDDI